MGLDGESIMVVEPAELARYGLGPPLTMTTATTPTAAEHDPRNSVVGFVQDQTDRQLWLGTRFAGLFACSHPGATAFTAQALTTLNLAACRHFTTFNSVLLDNAIQALLLDREGTLWVGIAQWCCPDRRRTMAQHPTGPRRDRNGGALQAQDEHDLGSAAMAMSPGRKAQISGVSTRPLTSRCYKIASPR